MLKFSPTRKAILRTGFASSIFLAFSAQAHTQEIGDPIPNSYICVFYDGVGSAGSKAQLAALNAGGQIKHVFSHALKGFSVTMSSQAVDQMMRANPEISYCEQDRYAGIPEPDASAQGKPGGGSGGGKGGGGGGGGGKPASAQTTPWGVTKVGGPANGIGKRAWVIDTGVDLDHPDLNVDAGSSVSFLTGDSSPDDFNGHGTHVAGTIAAIDNSFGVVGVAAGATVVSLRVLDRRGNGPDEGVIAAIDYAAAHAQPGDVINLSLITTYMQSMNDAVAAAGAQGIYVVAGAGNNSTNAGGYSPASAGGVNVYTTSAIADTNGTWAIYSNYGNPPVDYAEPGSNIESLDKNGGYTTKSGTSMAAPHLSGILLVNGGVPHSNGTAIGDPDGNPDPIGVR